MNSQRPSAPPVQQFDPRLYKEQSSSHRNGRRDNTPPESEGEWSSGLSSSGSDRHRAHNIDDNEYDFADQRRPKRSHRTGTRKVRRNVSHSRSRSRSHARRAVDSQKDRSSRKRRESQEIDPPPIGKYSATSSKSNSPRLPHSQVQPNIYIHMNAATPVEDQKHRREHEHMRGRRASHNALPTGYHKIVSSQPISRGSSPGYSSEAASFTDTSSIHTSEDIVIDDVSICPSHSKRHSCEANAPPLLRRNYAQTYPSQMYDEPTSPRYTTAPSFTQTQPRRPSLPYRPVSLQSPFTHNPFETTTYSTPHISLPRKIPPYTEALYTPLQQQQPQPQPQQQQQQQQRYVPNQSAQENHVNLRDLAVALEELKERKRMPIRRSKTEKVVGVGGDTWADGYVSNRGGYSGGAGY